ncbi:MAG: ABC transporter substrate-binding protein [Acidobacteria bacterium]|nr:ABC transporter substrate-binding protein [Acidobacteriota bacterium]
MTEPLKLHSLLGNHASTRALKSGEVSSPLVNFDYFDVKVANTQFKAMVREQKYDFGELAIVTFLQAKAYGKPYVVLPATIVGRNQHHTIFYNADKGALTPRDLNGKRIGVRAYTQTTGAWVRGFLADDYGVDLKTVTWVTFEEPHLAEYPDPPTVQRAPEGKVLKQMLLDGELDAAILGDVSEDGPIRHLIPDHEAAGRAWARAHGGVPINHLAVMRESIVHSRPDVVREVYRVLKESRAAADLPSGADNPLRFGIEGVRQSLAQISDYAHRQGLIPRAYPVDELFADASRILGDAAR